MEKKREREYWVLVLVDFFLYAYVCLFLFQVTYATFLGKLDCSSHTLYDTNMASQMLGTAWKVHVCKRLILKPGKPLLNLSSHLMSE